MLTFEINVICDNPDCPTKAMVATPTLRRPDVREALKEAARRGWAVSVSAEGAVRALCPHCAVTPSGCAQSPGPAS